MQFSYWLDCMLGTIGPSNAKGADASLQTSNLTQKCHGNWMELLSLRVSKIYAKGKRWGAEYWRMERTAPPHRTTFTQRSSARSAACSKVKRPPPLFGNACLCKFYTHHAHPVGTRACCMTVCLYHSWSTVIKIFDLVQRSQSGNVMNFGDCCSTEVLKVCRTRFTVCDLQ